MAIEICRIGKCDWPRYILVNRSNEGPRYWTGSGWSSELTSSCLFAFLPDVCREFERLRRNQIDGQFVQEFEAKITVKLQGDRVLTEQELARFLDRFAELFLPTDGPTDDSLVQAEIHWHELRERVRDNSSDYPPDDSLD